jgi:hypothetical protein
MPITRAISIKQPFVEQILRGIKRYEYRSQPTRIRERVYLYASLKPRTESSFWRSVGKKPGDLPVGLIVGSVEIVGCRVDPRGGFAYVLKNPKRLRTPLRARNQPQPKFWIPKF